MGGIEMMLKQLKRLRDVLLDQLGVVRQTTNIPLLNLGGGQFERDCIASESFHKRRIGIDHRVENNSDMLRDDHYANDYRNRHAD